MAVSLMPCSRILAAESSKVSSLRGVYGFFGGVRGNGVGVVSGGDIQLGLIVYFCQFGSLSSNQ